jgi:hypothetical protein
MALRSTGNSHYAVATNSQAQHAHDEGHYDYANWASKKTSGVKPLKARR